MRAAPDRDGRRSDDADVRERVPVPLLDLPLLILAALEDQRVRSRGVEAGVGHAGREVRHEPAAAHDRRPGREVRDAVQVRALLQDQGVRGGAHDERPVPRVEGAQRERVPAEREAAALVNEHAAVERHVSCEDHVADDVGRVDLVDPALHHLGQPAEHPERGARAGGRHAAAAEDAQEAAHAGRALQREAGAGRVGVAADLDVLEAGDGGVGERRLRVRTVEDDGVRSRCLERAGRAVVREGVADAEHARREPRLALAAEHHGALDVDGVGGAGLDQRAVPRDAEIRRGELSPPDGEPTAPLDHDVLRAHLAVERDRRLDREVRQRAPHRRRRAELDGAGVDGAGRVHGAVRREHPPAEVQRGAGRDPDRSHDDVVREPRALLRRRSGAAPGAPRR